MFRLIDCLNCQDGCNGGPGTVKQTLYVDEMERCVEQRTAGRRLFWQKKGRTAKAVMKKLDRTLASFWKPGLYGRTYTDRSEVYRQKIKIPSEADLQAIYNRMHKFTSADIFDCGSCGYDSCRQMAVAIFNGLNKPGNCRHYMAIEVQKTNNTLRRELVDSVQNVSDRAVSKLGETESAVLLL